jgi:putative nucleotidyltransferase with HDIG domain
MHHFRRTQHDNITRVMQNYLCALAAVALALALMFVFTSGWDANVGVVFALAVVAGVAERGRVQLSSTIQESISLLPTLFVAVLFGPLPAMFVAAASFLPELRPAPDTPSPYLRWGIYTSTRSITGGITAVVAGVAGASIGHTLTSIVVATTAGAFVAQILDAGFAALTLKLRRAASLVEVLRALGPLSLAAVPLYTPVVAFLAFAYGSLSPLTLPLFFVPALAAQRLFALYRDQRRLTVELLGANESLERVNLSFATALVATLDARDRYTAGHSAAVAIYARDIASRIGLDDKDRQLAYLAGLVHDIGKIGLPAGLLEKPGAITLEERRNMEQHSVIGERILANVETYAAIATVVRHHHERIDGTGYPDGLSGDDIPLVARIVAVADAYNAMTSDRPYRDAMPSRVARLRIAQAVETQFDTSVVAAFEAILASASEDYRLARQAEFNFELYDQFRDTETRAALRVVNH